jgi:hypothetical protein
MRWRSQRGEALLAERTEQQELQSLSGQIIPRLSLTRSQRQTSAAVLRGAWMQKRNCQDIRVASAV